MRQVLKRVSVHTADEFRRRAASRLRSQPAPDCDRPELGRGDHGLDPNVDQWFPAGIKFRPAAVLVPLVDRGDDLGVLLTLRPAAMRVHAGQVSFPGGKIESHDAGPLEAALRETREETGIDESSVEVLGFLDTYHTGTGFKIVPAVGLITGTAEIRPDPSEVDEVFEVPLSFLMDAANHRIESVMWQGRQRRYYAMPYRDRYIWGATAGILRNLFELLYAR